MEWWLARGHSTAEQFLGEVAIEVATWEGAVRLSGYAARDEDRERALDLAGFVSGVQTVEDDMCILDVDPFPVSRAWDRRRWVPTSTQLTPAGEALKRPATGRSGPAVRGLSA
ncbi:MAG: BON domain-containing protein [Gammaproteobacteria bacterium]